jgi:uncharacterized protein YbcI
VSTSELSGRLLGEVTNRIIGLFTQLSGKGPEQGKSYLDDDVLVCVLRGALTDMEETLLEKGRGDLVQQVRLEFERELRTPLMDAVAELTGRTVLDYGSLLLPAERTLVEVFVLDMRERR